MPDQRHATTHEHGEVPLVALAAGVLDEPERAQIPSHVDSCANCQAELERLSRAADCLVLLAPEIDPPFGFDMRVVERMHVDNSMTGVLAHEPHWTTRETPTRSEQAMVWRPQEPERRATPSTSEVA